MTDGRDGRIELQRVGGRGSRRRGGIAAGGVTAVFVAIVLAGRFGARAPAPEPRPAPSISAAAPASTGTPTPSSGPVLAPTAGVAHADDVAIPSGAEGSGFFSAADLGFLVLRATPVPETVVVHEDGRTIDFVFPRTNLPPSLGGGTIEVAVGTPGEGADIGDGRGTRVFADTLDALEAGYRAAESGVAGASDGVVDGRPARILEVPATLGTIVRDASTVALVVTDRDYIITATGFDAGNPSVTAATQRRALAQFIERFQFIGLPLFVSRRLGFEVPEPVNREPEVQASGDGRAGWVQFLAGTSFDGTRYPAVIRVDVGTKDHPAQIPVRPPAARPQPPGLWAPDQDALERQFLDMFGGGASALLMRVAGQRALRIQSPGDIGGAVIVAHGGRVYVIAVSSIAGPDAQKQFDQFVADFRFVDAPDG